MRLPDSAWVALIVFAISLTVVHAAPKEALVLQVWPSGAPGETGNIGEEKILPDRGTKKVIRVTNVTKPTLTLFQPPSGKANGCGVVICPGGGYNILAWDLEGTEVAQWLNSIGVTAVVLKYRVPRRDQDQPHSAPLQDAQRAIRLVRKNAANWGIDPDRLGLLGFSAGGHLTVMAGTHWDQTTYERIDKADDLSCRPDFLIPIYAAYLGAKEDPTKLSPLVQITKQTPPTFMAVTLDDKHRGLHAALVLVELKKAGVPAELHVYTKGGHGYGLRPSDHPVSTWHQRCGEWLQASGLLKAAKK
ncbi:MAG: alpha/beta hydrolase [Phycisphaerae bacterium]|nr:alpha/beta hydrolase [Phycisphaerae bacterium]